MLIALLVNPIAGRGQAPRVVAQFHSRLGAEGFTVESFEEQPQDPKALERFDAAVVVGGDGTVNRWLPLLSAASVPVWHVPMGTENLFARHFRHGPSIERFVDAARNRRVTTIDLGRCGDRLFAIMASLGPDADVVRAVAEQRTGPIRRLSYIGPVFDRFREGITTRAAVASDGRIVQHGAIGMLVVANLPSYAVGLNPAWHARPDDGTLSLVHLPGRGSIGVGFRLAVGLARVHKLVPGRTTAEARRIEVRFENAETAPPAVQVDGDLLPDSVWIENQLAIEVVPDALRVLRVDG